MKLLFYFCLLPFCFAQRESALRNTQVEFQNEEECGGYDPESFRIYAGRDAEVYEHPWYALISIGNRGDQARCGGSLINSQFVLSAAHCFDKLAVDNNKDLREYDLRTVHVKLAEHNTETPSDCEDDEYFSACNFITRDLKRALIHSGYKGKPDFTNDIALLKLQHKIFYDNGISMVRPVCLPIGNHGSMPLAGEKMVVTGFGRMGGGKDNMAKTKQKVTLTVLNDNECQNAFKNTNYQLKKDQPIKVNIDSTAQICAKGTNKEDTCNGDSGGPLVYNNTFLMGIVSFGPEDCGTGKFAAVFVRVSNYISWIQNGIRTLSNE